MAQTAGPFDSPTVASLELLNLVGPTVRGGAVAYQSFFLIWGEPRD